MCARVAEKTVEKDREIDKHQRDGTREGKSGSDRMIASRSEFNIVYSLSLAPGVWAVSGVSKQRFGRR